MRRGGPPASPLKVMVPVSMRRADETGPGNRISMVYVALPVHLSSPAGRLEAVREQMHALKASGRPEGTEMLYALGGLLPVPLRAPGVRALASPPIFNLTISQSPAPPPPRPPRPPPRAGHRAAGGLPGPPPPPPPLPGDRHGALPQRAVHRLP